MAKRRTKDRKVPADIRPVPRWLDVLLWFGFLALAFSLGCFLNRDMDIWWHLRAGNDILASGEIPRTDRYSFAAEGQPWIDLHWLFEVAMALAYRGGGAPLLTVIAAFVATTAVAILTATYRIPERFGLTLLCWGLPLVLMSGRFYVRPEVWSLAMLAVYMAVASRLREHPAGIWFLIPLQVVWCNFQGLFVLGYVVVAAFVSELIFLVLLRRAELPGWRFWLGFLLLCGAGLINPYGWRGLTFPIVLFQRLGAEHDFYGAHIGELLSIPDFIERNGIHNPYLVVHLALLAVVSASFLLPLFRLRFSPAMVVLWVGFAWLGWRATRNSGFYAAMAGCTLVHNLRLFLEGRPVRASSGVRIAGRLTGLAACGVAIALVLSGVWYRFAGEGRLVGLGDHPFWHAHDAARFVADERLPRYVAAYHEGQAALVEFYMPPEKRVWCDPRLEVIPREELEKYYQVADLLREGNPAWRSAVAALPDSIAFLLDHEGHGAAEATLLAAPDWVCVFFGDVAGVYLPRNEALIRGVKPLRFGERYYRLDELVPLPDWLPGELTRAEHCVQIGRSVLERRAPELEIAVALLLLGRAHAERAEQKGLDRFRAVRAAGMAALHLGTVELQPTESGGLPDPVQGRWLFVARRELEHAYSLQPADFVTVSYLFQARRLLGDLEAASELGEWLLQWRPVGVQQKLLLPPLQAQAREILERFRSMQDEASPPVQSLRELHDALDNSIKAGRYSAVRRLLVEFVDSPDGQLPRLPWDVADKFATVLLARGAFDEARRLWLAQAGKVPAGVLAARLATTWFAEGDYRAARDRYVEGISGGEGAEQCRLGIAWCDTVLRQPKGVVQALQTSLPPGAGRPADVGRVLVELAREALESGQPSDSP